MAKIYDITTAKGLADYVAEAFACNSDKSIDGRHKWELIKNGKNRMLICTYCGVIIITERGGKTHGKKDE